MPKTLPYTRPYINFFGHVFDDYYRDFPRINTFIFNLNTSFMQKSSSTTYPSYKFVWELRTRTYEGEQPQFQEFKKRSKESTLGERIPWEKPIPLLMFKRRIRYPKFSPKVNLSYFNVHITQRTTPLRLNIFFWLLCFS